MGKRKKNKKKKQTSETIRTDVWNLVARPSEKQQLMTTVTEYRKFLKPLVLIINAAWVNLGDLNVKEKVNAVEKMIHKTTENPDPKHKYFQKVVDKYPSFRKFPSYLRRAAIESRYWNSVQFPQSLQGMAIWHQVKKRC